MAAGDGVRAASEPAFSWRRCKRRFARNALTSQPPPNLPRRRAGFFRVSRFQREALMAKPRIAIIIGSTRDTRFGDKPAKWIYEKASQRGDIDVELVDLRDWPLPFFNEVDERLGADQERGGPALAEEARRVRRLHLRDAGIQPLGSGIAEERLDFAYPEWNRKAAAYVGYGGVGGPGRGAPAQHLGRAADGAGTLRRPYRRCRFRGRFQGPETLDDLAYLEQNAKDLLDNLVWWTNALKAAREKA